MEETTRNKPLPDEYPPPKGTFKTLYKGKWYRGTEREQHIQMRIDDLEMKCSIYRFAVTVLAALTFLLLTTIVIGASFF